MTAKGCKRYIRIFITSYVCTVKLYTGPDIKRKTGARSNERRSKNVFFFFFISELVGTNSKHVGFTYIFCQSDRTKAK